MRPIEYPRNNRDYFEKLNFESGSRFEINKEIIINQDKKYNIKVEGGVIPKKELVENKIVPGKEIIIRLICSYPKNLQWNLTINSIKEPSLANYILGSSDEFKIDEFKNNVEEFINILLEIYTEKHKSYLEGLSDTSADPIYSGNSEIFVGFLEESYKEAIYKIGESRKDKGLQILAHILKNSKEPREFIEDKIRNCRFILIGETHVPDKTMEMIRNFILSNLRDFKEQGLTHICLEAPRQYQELMDEILNDEVIEKIKKIDKLELNFSEEAEKEYEEACKIYEDALKNLKEKIKIIGWTDTHYKIIIEAKKLGLEVQLIDYADERPDLEKDSASYQNLRDSMMMEKIKELIESNPNAKILILIGNAHVHKKPVESYADGYVKRLGFRLVEEYGDEAVVSIRYCSPKWSIDDSISFISGIPRVNDVSQRGELSIIPDTGPVKDERITASDYIFTQI